ncbi:MAG: acetylornithine and succinylornithine aminotransferase [Bacilli bacterium]|nr:acetylornithine and succinylornithine aminotransferase [Bacilli bacterium]
MSDAVMNTYSRAPISLVKGQGDFVWDSNGKRYLDFTCGIAVTNLGHCHPAVTQAITEQAATLVHCSNLYWIPSQVELAELLTAKSFADQAFFCNTGTEANEAALKLVRKYSTDHFHPERTDVIAFENSFHGRTYGALSLTGRKKYQEGFGPMLPGVKFAEAGSLASLSACLTDNTCAVFMELVQGEGGVIELDPAFVQAVRKFCDEHQLLLVMDEIQTGMGRTGTLFAYEQFAVAPDVLTLAKGLANGVPIGALLAKREISQSFTPGIHGSTFAGNPLATTAALATVHTMLQPGFLQRVIEQGELLRGLLEEQVSKHECAVQVRGRGLMRGLKLNQPAGDIVKACLDKGLLLTAVGSGDTIRFLPTLLVTEDLLRQGVRMVDEVLTTVDEANLAPNVH